MVDRAPPLLERDSQLTLLRRYAVEAGQGTGRLVLLAGEAGVGKTTLLEGLRRELTDVRWSWSACDGLFVPRPLGPLYELADQLGGELPRQCRTGGDRADSFRALLRELSAPGVVDVAVVEDIHWADDATLDLLRFLGRRLRDAAVLLIATYRDDETAGDTLRLAQGDLAAQPCTERIRLPPLSVDAVRALSRSGGADGDRLFELTGGNPFFVTELLQAGMASGVPASARDVVLARAACLGSRARACLEVASLIGTRVELALVLELGEDLALEELLASGLLVAEGRWLRFRHEIARLAVAQAVPAHRSHTVHRQILAALRARGCADDARMAFHAEAAGDTAAVLHYAPSAAHRAAQLGSHRQAAAQYERALRFADGAGVVARATLYDRFAEEAAVLDHLAVAEDAAERALSLWHEAGDHLRMGIELTELARIRWRLCRGREAEVAVGAGVAVLVPLGPTRELSRAYATLAKQRMLHADYDAATALARRAQELAVRFGAGDLLSDALNTEATSASCRGLEWTTPMRRALDIALAGGHQNPAARAYVNLCVIAIAQCRFVVAQHYLTEGIAYCDERDATTYASHLRVEQANLLERTGRWDEAIALTHTLSRGVDLSPVSRLGGLVLLGVIRARRGQPGAWECLDEAAVLADDKCAPPFQVLMRLARAEAYWLVGRHGEARREAEAAEQVGGTRISWLRGAVAAWLRRTGSPCPVHGDLAERYRYLLNGDATRAAAAWTELGCSYEAGLVLLESGQEALLRQALAIFTDLGATAAAKLTRRALRRLGARAIPTGPRHTTEAHPLGLTRREHEVANLIAEGHTNAQIADHLVISTRTVDHHVSAILTKLGVSNRAAAGPLLTPATPPEQHVPTSPT